ncbi:bacillopeptidase F (M6 metalloprotease family) [Neisseria sp. HSC-16F19]|nr:prokaryotic membrane lipolipid attachment site family protein [Neisseria sp. HSC-16F19]MCP2040431.1 bacillopeptidase F (M6 metalloprotease family) [Neisseria sp. HSC-16F19]
MKRTLALLTLAAFLGGCTVITTPGGGTVVPPRSSTQQPPAYRLASSHWSDVAKIREEATMLNRQVANGQITKVQAAQRLNQLRIKLVGRNVVDDDMYEIYLRSATRSQANKISSAQSKQFVQDGLRSWQQRWPHMTNKPANPAFTNFLMEAMGMRPLQ